MLRRLFLKDFAIAHEIDIDLHAGFGVVSGETGAGKSLLVDALLLLTGSRADSAVVRHGCERAELQAEFDIARTPEAALWLREQDFDDDGLCQLRRVVRADGGSRAWINARPATANQLAVLGALLVEIHGQHEHQALLDRGHQLGLLDAFGQHAALGETVQSAARRWREARRQLESLGAGDHAERISLLEHQYRELESLQLAPEAIESLQREQRRQHGGVRLIENLQRALAELSDEHAGARRGMIRALHALDEAIRLEPELAAIRQTVHEAAIQIDEASLSIERQLDGLELDPERLAELEAELDRLHELARKHRVRILDLADHRSQLGAELERWARAEQSIEALQREQADARAEWVAAAAALRARRHEAAVRFAEQTSDWMHRLGMPGGRLEVAFEEVDADSDPLPGGSERIELLVTANPGQPPRPLRKVASGGELARISLAIEVSSLGADRTPTMVFDEVDSGIGGAIAEVVGRTLRGLAAKCQVLCVTHLPQVAAQGHYQYRVEKAISDGAAHSRILQLDAASRRQEIARMLGGVEITKATLKHADQMLASAQEG